MGQIIKVLFLAAEADPLVKVGGLGDVAGSLPRALRSLSSAELGVDVRLVLPYYGGIRGQKRSAQRIAEFTLATAGRPAQVGAFELEVNGLPVYLIAGENIPAEAPVYSSDTLVDGKKFTFFSLAALELARQLKWQPDIVHANDWHTAAAVYGLSRMRKKDRFYRRTATLLSLHNLPYMGAGAGPALAAFGLPPAKDSGLPTWAEYFPLPLGLLTADHIVAVSPTYAREILTPEFGCGLEDFLARRREHISGILNGLDVESWNPQNDTRLAVQYGSHNLEERRTNKRALQTEAGLAEEERTPLIAIVSRLDMQKGIDLALEGLRKLTSTAGYKRKPWQAIVLGTGDRKLEAEVNRLATEYPRRVSAAICFDADLSHRVYGGADILLVPSRYEPCGLTQMIAMRYGCVPVARAIGGLRDTIQDYTQTADSTGFLFEEASATAVAVTLGKALKIYQDQSTWTGLQERGMWKDFSWDHSAREYLEIYKKLKDE